jgi:carbon-monoxide dehydrogenase medium subunit
VKPAAFGYAKARTLDHALELLASGEGARILAGGQSLIPALNMRLDAPRLLVDINGISELEGIARQNGDLRIGALTRHAAALRSDAIAQAAPLIAMAMPHVAHPAIRNRGTLGGSLAYADPAAELPACAVALDATLVLGSLTGEREVKAEDFFKGLFETDLRAGELILAVKFPVPQQKPATAFSELARRHGDFALVGLAAVATLERHEIKTARLVYLGCSDRAKLARSVSSAITGVKLPVADGAAFDAAIENDLDPDDTPGLRADTRIHMAKVLTRRVLNALTEQVSA